MPVHDSWLRGFASGSSVSMNSAGSSDSMISINSGYSDDSMEHLSAEERECLMFLEETIESLETEVDGGIMNDEPEHQSHIMPRMNQPDSVNQPKPGELSSCDEPNKVLEKDRKNHSLLVPTPLVLANGNGKFVKKPVLQVNKPNSTALNSHHSTSLLDAGNELHKSPTSPRTPEPNGDLDLPPPFIPVPPVKTGLSSGAKAKDSTPTGNLDPDQNHESFSSEVLLPPPSDFMDEPIFPLPSEQVQTQTQLQLQPEPSVHLHSDPYSADMGIAPPPGFGGYSDTDKAPSPMAASPKGILSVSELENLRKKASTKRAPEKVPVVAVRPPAQKVSEQPHFPTSGPDSSSFTPVEHGEPKSPPAVAPKPKKLPPSIVLKSHKDPGPGHSLVSPGDRMITNPQKVHIEALKKLGLLKGDEPASGVSPVHKVSPQASSNTSTYVPGPTRDSNTAEQQVVLGMDGNNGLLLPQSGNSGKDSPPNIRAPSPKPFEIKSVPMEQSGSGLKSLRLERPSIRREKSPEQSNVVLSSEHSQRNHSRPASAGSWKDLGIEPSEINKQPEIRRSRQSLHLPSPSADSQKPLRSHGVSVIISPQSRNEEGRKQALKRLGLIKD